MPNEWVIEAAITIASKLIWKSQRLSFQFYNFNSQWAHKNVVNNPCLAWTSLHKLLDDIVCFNFPLRRSLQDAKPNGTRLWIVKLFNLLDLLHPLGDVFINSFRLFVKLFTLLWWKCAQACVRRLLGDVCANLLALLLSRYWIKDENLLLTRKLPCAFRIVLENSIIFMVRNDFLIIHSQRCALFKYFRRKITWSNSFMHFTLDRKSLYPWKTWKHFSQIFKWALVMISCCLDGKMLNQIFIGEWGGKKPLLSSERRFQFTSNCEHRNLIATPFAKFGFPCEDLNAF